MAERPLEIFPESRHHWVVRYEGDATPLSEHATQSDADAEALNRARQFGVAAIHIHDLHGEHSIRFVEPDFPAPTPGP
jgi:hypothetical protein